MGKTKNGGYKFTRNLTERREEINALQTNTVCKEHEWAVTSGGDTDTSIICRNCGTPKPIDFHIKENLDQINKQQWEDIWNKFTETDQFKYNSSPTVVFVNWLKENYLPPVKKV